MKATPKGQETRAISEAEYKEIITTMRKGVGGFFQPNAKAAMALVLEANLGIRISDICKLCLRDLVRENGKWRLSIVEQKTGKPRFFTVPDEVYQGIVEYCYSNGIKPDERIIQIKPRAVQTALKNVVDFLEMDRVGTHSFRKFFASRIYEENGHDTELVREILQHGSLETTQRYLRATSQRVESALNNATMML